LIPTYLNVKDVQFWGNNIIRTPKIMKRLFSESGSDANHEGQCEAEAIEEVLLYSGHQTI